MLQVRVVVVTRAVPLDERVVATRAVLITVAAINAVMRAFPVAVTHAAICSRLRVHLRRSHRCSVALLGSALRFPGQQRGNTNVLSSWLTVLWRFQWAAGLQDIVPPLM